jgi:hypothetical protein
VPNTRQTILKIKGCLSEFRTPPFCLPVPLDMLREKCGSPDSERAATTTTRRINTNHNLMMEAYQLSEDQQSQLNIDTINLLNGLETELQDKVKLKPPPSIIADRYSVVTGDPFHYMKRTIRPKDHEIVKEFSNRLTRAWVDFEPRCFTGVEDTLREQKGLSDTDIQENDIRPQVFSQTLPAFHFAPINTLLAIASVYCWYGAQMSKSLKNPLFNDVA